MKRSKAAVLPIRDSRAELADVVLAYGRACGAGQGAARILHFNRFLDLVYSDGKQRTPVVDIASLAPDYPPAA